MDVSFFVVSCDGWQADGITEASMITQQQRTLHDEDEEGSNDTRYDDEDDEEHSSTDDSDGRRGKRKDKKPSKRTAIKYTRNLVGSLVASAVKLYDPQGQLGIFFIFQDLSIRLEGKYRLGFTLVDVHT